MKTPKITAKRKPLTIGKLKAKAQSVFNKWIRQRDKNKGCISCPSKDVNHASHYYSAGHYNHLRFNEDNVHGSCVKCNTYLHGNIHEYRKGLINRIGIERLEKLELQASMRVFSKDNRFYFEEIITQYKTK